MRLYCMCEAMEVATDGLRDMNAQGETIGIGLPENPMTVARVGVRQFIVDLIADGRRVLGRNDLPPRLVSVKVREHFPMVDIRSCPECGASVAVSS